MREKVKERCMNKGSEMSLRLEFVKDFKDDAA